jgi:hypothetical protein
LLPDFVVDGGKTASLRIDDESQITVFSFHSWPLLSDDTAINIAKNDTELKEKREFQVKTQEMVQPGGNLDYNN